MRLYEQLFEAAPLPLLVYRWDGSGDLGAFRLIATNAAARELRGELRADGDRLSAETAQRLAGSLRRRERQQWTMRTVDDDDGRERSYATHCFPVEDHVAAMVLFDVTDRREMERELAKHVSELERSNRMLDELASAASHDLKAPLRDVENLARWVADDAGDALSPASKKHLGLLKERVHRMARLLDDLLAYARAGRRLEAPMEVDVREVAEDAVALVRRSDGIAVSVSGNGRLRIQRAALAQIVRNLVDNAIKHHDRETGTVRVTIAEEPDTVEVCVIDDGPGIPEELHERAFRMFQTLRPRDEKEGSGMGLAIVKRLVESTHGALSLRSAPGDGTTLRLVWPALHQGARA